MDIGITALAAPSPDAAPCEMVERKGLGHPDSICDALAENLGIGLARFYLERFGRILHHNVDKALLLGGAAEPCFGGGRLLEPIEITLAGRATRSWQGVEVPVDDLAVELSREWLRRNLRNIDPVRDVRIVTRVRETSPDLKALFARRREGETPLANDTSFGVGFAPLDRLERAVLAVERDLAGARDRFPELGEDVKVLGLRRGDRTDITLACALVGRHVKDLDDYRAKKQSAGALAARAAQGEVAGVVEASVNAADGDTADSIYLTVTGLSAEAGDDGQVGRGNRINGLITPYRPMSLEAAAGKNPVNHTGKLYNFLAQRIAATLVAELPGVEEAYCYLLSRIGAPITQPQLVDVAVRMAPTGTLEAVRGRILEIAHAQLHCAPQLWRDVLDGQCAIC